MMNFCFGFKTSKTQSIDELCFVIRQIGCSAKELPPARFLTLHAVALECSPTSNTNCPRGFNACAASCWRSMRARLEHQAASDIHQAKPQPEARTVWS